MWETLRIIEMSVPLDAKQLHASLKNELSGYLHPDLEPDYDQFVNLLSVYLKPAERSKKASLFDLLENLERKGLLGVGNYSVLKSIITNPEIRDKIEEYEHKIQAILHPKRVLVSTNPTDSVSPTGKRRDPLTLTEADLQRLASCFGFGWELFVGQLGIDSATIDQKKMENPNHVPTQIYHCLRAWWICQRSRPTINDFHKALTDSLECVSFSCSPDKYEQIKSDIENRRL